ncbi:MAG TPA: hypothetical protein PKA36_15115 [Pseudoxanthomonas mexicana]|nr:hypothetical protein [Pseudoxanthomonas mexicana]
MRQNTTRRFALAVALALAIGGVHAHDGKAHTGGIPSTANKAVTADFDIVHTKISTDKNIATFHMAVSGKAGKSTPAATGKLAGSNVFSYVWPTTIDPYEVGFASRFRRHAAVRRERRRQAR